MERAVAHQAEGTGVLPKAERVQNPSVWVKTSVSSQAVWFCPAEGWHQPHSCSFQAKELPLVPARCSSDGEGAGERRVSSVMT